MARKKGRETSETPDFSVDHAVLCDWVRDFEDSTQYAYEIAEKSRNYYDSEQLSQEERRTLNARKQAPVVINRIKPKIDGLFGLEKQNRTTAKAYPRTPRHQGAAQAATEAIRFVLQDQDYHTVRSTSFENIAIEGTAGVEVIVKPVGDDEYKICLNPIFADRLVYDPHARRKDFKDARYLGQSVWMDYDEAVAKNPGGEDVLGAMFEGKSQFDDRPRWMDTKRNRVKIVEIYYHKDGDCLYARFTGGGYLVEPKVSPYKNEEGETEWPYEFASAFVDAENQRYGAVKQLLDVQDEINKRRSKALHLMSVRQIRLERGAVEDVNKVRQELAKPDGVVETTPGMEFEVLKTGDMAAAQFNLLTEAKMEIDAVGFNAAVSGKDEKLQSGVALRARAQSGQTELAPIFDVLKNLDLRVYRKIWNRIHQYWTAEKWIRVTDEEQNLKWVGLNAPITKGQQLLEQAQANGAPPQLLAQLQQQIQVDPMMSEVVETKNEIAQLDVDIVIQDAPDTVTTQVEDFQVIGEMVKSGFPMPPEAVIEASPLSNKDKILKMMKEQPRIPPELQQKIQQLEEENAKLKQDQAEEMAKLQMEEKKIQSQLALQKMKQDGELALARAKAEAELKLKADIANSDAKLELISIQNDKELALELEGGSAGSTSSGSPKKRPASNLQGMVSALTALAQATQQNAQMLAQILALQSSEKTVTVSRQADGSLEGHMKPRVLN